MRAAILNDKKVKDFRAEFESKNTGLITWDFFGELKETRHKFRLDIIPDCKLCLKEK